jgi:MFS transporter, SHS family, sialic acid transporter
MNQRERTMSGERATVYDPAPNQAPISRGQWMVLAAAFLGWMFDGLEMGLFPLVARPCLQELLGSDREVGRWIGVVTAVFLVGAATGGVLFGWLGDRVGRVRAMMLSVLTYASCSGLCGLSGSATQLAAYRFIASLGMGGEWSLGVALVMEAWPNRSRAFLAGLIGAASNVGFLSMALVGLGLSTFVKSAQRLVEASGLPANLVERLFAYDGWRLLMLLGATPALLTVFVRVFVPESEKWRQARDRGAASHWAAYDLLAVLVGGAAILGVVCVWAVDGVDIAGRWRITFDMPLRWTATLLGVAAATAGYIYPVLRYLQRAAKVDPLLAVKSGTLPRMLLGASLSGVALLGTWGSLQWATPWADELAGKGYPEAKAYTQIAGGLGAIVGTMLAAYMGDWFGRRISYFLLCLSSLGSAAVLFRLNTSFGPAFIASVFLAGMCTASFYGWLPLYLPELFRTSVRATGQGFGFNFGRILAAVGSLQTGYLMAHVFQGSYPKACAVTSLIYVVGMVLIWFAPETRGQPLPD